MNSSHSISVPTRSCGEKIAKALGLPPDPSASVRATPSRGGTRSHNHATIAATPHTAPTATIAARHPPASANPAATMPATVAPSP